MLSPTYYFLFLLPLFSSKSNKFHFFCLRRCPVALLFSARGLFFPWAFSIPSNPVPSSSIWTMISLVFSDIFCFCWDFLLSLFEVEVLVISKKLHQRSLVHVFFWQNMGYIPFQLCVCEVIEMSSGLCACGFHEKKKLELCQDYNPVTYGVWYTATELFLSRY